MGASDFLESVERNEKGNMKNKDTYESLKYIYDTLGYTAGDQFQSFAGKPSDYWEENGSYLDFDQTEFFDVNFDAKEYRGRELGKIYIPNQCYDTTCRVHFAFHRNNKQPDEMAVKKRYNIIGALNDIIMVYPTTKSWDSHKITD